MAESFTGEILQAEARKTLYQPGEALILHVKAHAKITWDYLTWNLWWLTMWRVYSQSGVLLTEESSRHLLIILPWTHSGEGEDDMDLVCGEVPGYSQNVVVQLYGQFGADPQFISNVYVPVKVVGQPSDSCALYPDSDTLYTDSDSDALYTDSDTYTGNADA